MPNPQTVQKIGITMEEYRIFRENDPLGGPDQLWAAIGWRLHFDSGESVSKSATMQLTGTARTRALALLQDLRALAKAEDSIP